MAYRPLFDNLVIELHEADSTTESGIVIDAGPTKVQALGTVLAVGPGKTTLHTGELVPTTVKENDIVLFDVNVLVTAPYVGEKTIILSESSILAVQN